MVRQSNEPVDQTLVESVEIVVGDQQEEERVVADNLADEFEEEQLSELASDLIQAYDADVRSRSDWEENVKKGMELLGLKLEDMQHPFPGAC